MNKIAGNVLFFYCSRTVKSLYLNGFQNYYNPTSYANTSFDNFSSTIHTSLSFEGSNSSTPYGGGDSGVTGGGGGDGNNPSPKASGDMTLLNDSKLEITNEEGSESTKQEPVSENGGEYLFYLASNRTKTLVVTFEQGCQKILEIRENLTR